MVVRRAPHPPTLPCPPLPTTGTSGRGVIPNNPVLRCKSNATSTGLGPPGKLLANETARPAMAVAGRGGAGRERVDGGRIVLGRQWEQGRGEVGFD